MSITAEYTRFLQFLHQKKVEPDVCRLANCVKANLNDLAEFGSARRARSTRLGPLLLLELETTNPDISVPPPLSIQTQVVKPRLHELVVGPFRGFTAPETFDLGNNITLVYGANGTGKSSFCEALETAMLGHISEAQAKRVDHRNYCNNLRLRHHTAPMLTVRAGDGKISQLTVNEALHRFCFIEKNRLDDFARISARTPADQRQLIATLFGIDQFSEFVRGFNQSLDDNLQLVGPKATQLRLAREQLAVSIQTVSTYPKHLEAHSKDEAALADVVRPGQNYAEVCTWLLGTQEAPGRLPIIQAQLDAPSLPIRGFTVDWLAQLRTAFELAVQEWKAVTATLARRAGEVSYTRLYEAVLALADGRDSCPACGTGLMHVQYNPFERAQAGILELAELATLQQREADTKENLTEASRALWAGMGDVIATLRTSHQAEFTDAQLPALPAGHAGEWFAKWVDEAQNSWAMLLYLVCLIEQQDAVARSALAEREQLISERNKLDEHRLSVERLRTVAGALQVTYENAQSVIKQFEETNSELMAEVEKEKTVTALNERVKKAYDQFLPMLQDYLGLLPAQLIQGLANSTLELYNAFNRSDHDSEKLTGLWLPITANENIELEFAGSPGVRYNALVILSEGHIRCLGLAILVAKNIEQQCPVVIFDDVVNAIDDEHRDGIWRTFFEDGQLEKKQVILTSHSEEFLLRIQQELGAVRAGKIKRYKFLPRAGGHELRIDSEPPTKNYVLLAREALEGDEKRDALRHSRPAIESLTDQLWTWLGRRGDGRLELKLPGPRSPWELNNKCLKLRSALNRMVAQHPNVAGAVTALDALLGVNGNSIEWGYLNSGTHDSQRDHDFDRVTVRTVVHAVVTLDEALVALRNG